MNINRTKTLNGTKAFDQNDIINYIKYQNKNKTRNENNIPKNNTRRNKATHNSWRNTVEKTTTKN